MKYLIIDKTRGSIKFENFPSNKFGKFAVFIIIIFLDIP